jgi:DNA-binding response OmpR family regulator
VAAELCRSRRPEVVVLDGATLRRDGGRALTAWRVATACRARPPAWGSSSREVPDPDDRRLGAELGVEDYPAQPFAPTFLARRVRELAGSAAR